MKSEHIFRYLFLSILNIFFHAASLHAVDSLQTRILISSDIGGTDPDDFQSMVHLFLYADTFDIEGLISSPHGEGRASHIMEVINEYEKDFSKISSYSDKYPSPDSLRKLVKQGETEIATPVGYRESTEGSDWIIQCAKRDDPRDLHVLVWGGIEDLAQALHDAPEIQDSIKVYWIGGPNKKWSVNAYQYIADNFPDLWIIESNATYRGWFVGGDMSGNLGNTSFVREYIDGFGAMGDYFVSKKNEVKMGDTPSLMRLFYGTANDPTKESWGGSYVRAWDRPFESYKRLTTDADTIEEFGVMELLFPVDTNGISEPYATLEIDRDIKGMIADDTLQFLFSPKKAGKFDYKIVSNIPSVNGNEGTIISRATPPSNKDYPSADFPNWWVDDPSPEMKEGDHIGAKTINIWREDFLMDFASRMYRCKYFPNTYFKLSVLATNGSVNIDIADTAYLAGSKVTLTAVPDVGYEFVRWEGDASGTKQDLVVTMDEEKNIEAVFAKPNEIANLKAREIVVYPTSFTNYVIVSNLNNEDEKGIAQVYDLQGKTVRSVELLPGQSSLRIDLNNLVPGTYLMRIIYGELQYNTMLVKK